MYIFRRSERSHWGELSLYLDAVPLFVVLHGGLVSVHSEQEVVYEVPREVHEDQREELVEDHRDDGSLVTLVYRFGGVGGFDGDERVVPEDSQTVQQRDEACDREGRVVETGSPDELEEELPVACPDAVVHPDAVVVHLGKAGLL